MDKNFYNASSAKSLGWDASWFGEKHYDDRLVRAIKKFQREHGLKADGLCGATTYRVILTERQSKVVDNKVIDKKYSNYIVFNNELTEIEWDKLVLWTDTGGLRAKEGTYYDYSGRPKRTVRYFVNHWDVCLSSQACQNVLDDRGISVHFLIDNDGTIYQTMDMQHAAWHAGSERTNRPSIGVEISNAYYLKYQKTYVSRGFGERPIITGARVHHGELEPFLGFYPEQIKAAKALWKAVHKATGIPLQTPLNQFGKTSTVYEQDYAYGKAEGFVSHYHVNKAKIDCAGLDIKELIEEIK